MKIKIWFIYEGITTRNCEITKKVIRLVNEIEKTYDKEMLDLKSIDYDRFIIESKNIDIKKNDLPIVMINDRVLRTLKNWLFSRTLNQNQKTHQILSVSFSFLTCFHQFSPTFQSFDRAYANHAPRILLIWKRLYVK